jgi:two-component system, sensor histidine kinase and response regulator
VKLSNVSIRGQLFFLVGSLLLILVGMSTVSVVQLGRANERLVAMYVQRLMPVQDLKVVSDMYAVQIVDTVHKVQHQAVTWEQGLETVRLAEVALNKHWRRYLAHELTEAEQDMVAEAEALMSLADSGIVKLKTVFASQNVQALEAFSIEDLYKSVDPITLHLGKLVALQQEQARLLYESSQADYERMRTVFLGLLLVLVAAGAGMGVLVVRGVRRPLIQAQQAAQRMSQGDLSQRIAVEGRNESAQLLRALNLMQEQLVGQEDQRWVKSHAAEITTAMQQADSHTELGQVFLSRVAPLVQAGHAVFYVMNPDQRLQLLSTYGYQERKELSNLYEVGEGLVGQCALERTPITLTDPPADYVRIASGLGDGVPAGIVLLPVLKLEEVLGVLELAAFHHFTPREIALLDTLVPMMALNLEILQRKMRTQRLLEETQDQAQRMEKQAAQLEEQAVEMEAQQAELMDTEAWYRSIVESAPEGMLVANEAGTIILCNARLEEVFGYEHGELLGQVVEVLVPDDVRAHHPQNRARFMASDGYRPIESGMALRGRRKNGEEFPGEFGLSVLPTRGSRGRCVAVSVRDISARKVVD